MRLFMTPHHEKDEIKGTEKQIKGKKRKLPEY
jgi:hypothetical protein